MAQKGIPLPGVAGWIIWLLLFLPNMRGWRIRPELLDDVASQLLIAECRTRNPLTGLLHHAYDESREQEWAHPEHGRSPHAWVRAIGWYSMAIVDVLDFMPINHRLRGQLIGTYERLFAALTRVQDSATGLWHQVLGEEGRSGNYLESSGSAMIVYAAQKALNQGYLSGKYRASADQGHDGLLKHAAKMDEAGMCRCMALTVLRDRAGSLIATVPLLIILASRWSQMIPKAWHRLFWPAWRRKKVSLL